MHNITTRAILPIAKITVKNPNPFPALTHNPFWGSWRAGVVANLIPINVFIPELRLASVLYNLNSNRTYI